MQQVLNVLPTAPNLEYARASLIAAVRRYASEPTDANADGVAQAITQLRRARALSRWRESYH